MPVIVPRNPNGTAAFSLTLTTLSNSSKVALLSGGSAPKCSDGYNKTNKTPVSVKPRLQTADQG